MLSSAQKWRCKENVIILGLTLLWYHGYSTNADGGDNTGGAYALDSHQFYPYNTNGSTLIPVYAGEDANLSVPNNATLIGDDPNINCSGITTIHKDFKDYIRFQASAANSIFVTLGTLNWHVYATAVPSGTNYILMSTNTAADTSFTDSTDLPQWTNVLHNQ